MSCPLAAKHVAMDHWGGAKKKYEKNWRVGVVLARLTWVFGRRDRRVCFSWRYIDGIGCWASDEL